MSVSLSTKKLLADTLNYRRTLPSKSNNCREEGTLISYCEAVKILLKIYITDAVLAKLDGEVLCYT